MKTGSGNGTHMVDILFTLALFCVFAASALLVVLIGANVYKGTVSQMEDNFASRTSVTYVATKIRQNDVEGGVTLTSFGDSGAVVLRQDVEGDVYETWIYYHDGFLRELFVRAGSELFPEAGQSIVEIAGFSIEADADGRKIAIASTDEEGRSSRLSISPRCGVADYEEVSA